MSLAKDGRAARAREEVTVTLRYGDVIAWQHREHIEWQVEGIYTFTDEVELSMVNGKAKKVSKLRHLQAALADGRALYVARGPEKDPRWRMLPPW